MVRSLARNVPPWRVNLLIHSHPSKDAWMAPYGLPACPARRLRRRLRCSCTNNQARVVRV
jgi:hypothetical protein